MLIDTIVDHIIKVLSATAATKNCGEWVKKNPFMALMTIVTMSSILISVNNTYKFLTYQKNESKKPSARIHNPKGDVNLRNGPGIGYNVMAIMHNGLEIEVTGPQYGNWISITVNIDGVMMHGFANKNYLEYSNLQSCL